MSMREYIDHLGRKVVIPVTPQRIVSLVPSITELLFDLGLDERIAGITRYCVHPEMALNEKVVVGGTKKQNLSKLIALQPDLVIANKEENRKEDIEAIASQLPVWVSEVKNLADQVRLINNLGEICGKQEKAKEVIVALGHHLSAIQVTKRYKVAYLIWMHPFMSVGRDTYIHHVLDKCGLDNVFSEKERYPETTIEELEALDLDLILLSSEPYRFSEEEGDQIQKQLSKAKVIHVDGEAFSWYGSRLIHLKSYLGNFVKSLESV